MYKRQRLARRRDELGLLAKDFNRMGERLQGLIGSQRQLLRDVSHELRSPLAVSYTHLDVYKRQREASPRRARTFCSFSPAGRGCSCSVILGTSRCSNG